MLKKTLPLIGIILLSITLVTMKTAKAAPAVTIAVVFENGQHTINKNVSDIFTVSINIIDATNIDFFDIGIQWNPTALELNGTYSTAVKEGGFMEAFGSTVFPGPSPSNTNLTAGYMSDIPCGFLTGGPASGNGTLFTVDFHAKAENATGASIVIMSPNTVSYLLLGPNLVNIDAVVDGSVTVIIPEFPASAILPLFLAATTIAIAAATLSSRKRRILHGIS